MLSASSLCTGLQPRQPHADAGDAKVSRAVVADQPARQADQDRRGPYVTFHMAEVAVSWRMFADMLALITRLRAPTAPA
jgi:hypothetical protein